MSEGCERTNKLTSEWPSTFVLILGCSESLCYVATSASKRIGKNSLDFEHQADVFSIQDGNVSFEGKRLGVDETEFIESDKDGASFGNSRLTRPEHA